MFDAPSQFSGARLEARGPSDDFEVAGRKLAPEQVLHHVPDFMGLPAREQKKTRWDILALLVIPVLMFAAMYLWGLRQEERPLPEKLRGVFRESGFRVPDYVSEIEGEMGIVDGQGDYSAALSFTVRPEDIGAFMRLSGESWKNPSEFKALEHPARVGQFTVPEGAYLIRERDSGAEREGEYGVDPKTNRIYFFRSSW